MEDSFVLLEEKVHKAADLVKRLRKENKALTDEAARSKSSLQDAEKKLAALQKEKAQSSEQGDAVDKLRSEVGQLQKERTEVRNRIAKLVELLEGLD
jgi:predicted RNase H-like nuclease (RuvC/YqgF family)